MKTARLCAHEHNRVRCNNYTIGDRNIARISKLRYLKSIVYTLPVSEDRNQWPLVTNP